MADLMVARWEWKSAKKKVDSMVAPMVLRKAGMMVAQTVVTKAASTELQ